MNEGSSPMNEEGSDLIPTLGNVFLTVPDMEEAVHFYSDVVGLRLKFQDGKEWAAFDGGGCTLALAKGTPGETTASLKVGDLDAWKAAADSAGAITSEVEVGPHERLVRVTDPAGNSFIVYEPR